MSILNFVVLLINLLCTAYNLDSYVEDYNLIFLAGSTFNLSVAIKVIVDELKR